MAQTISYFIQFALFVAYTKWHPMSRTTWISKSHLHWSPTNMKTAELSSRFDHSQYIKGISAKCTETKFNNEEHIISIVARENRLFPIGNTYMYIICRNVEYARKLWNGCCYDESDSVTEVSFKRLWLIDLVGIHFWHRQIYIYIYEFIEVLFDQRLHLHLPRWQS